MKNNTNNNILRFSILLVVFLIIASIAFISYRPEQIAMDSVTSYYIGKEGVGNIWDKSITSNGDGTYDISFRYDICGSGIGCLGSNSVHRSDVPGSYLGIVIGSLSLISSVLLFFILKKEDTEVEFIKSLEKDIFTKNMKEYTKKRDLFIKDITPDSDISSWGIIPGTRLNNGVIEFDYYYIFTNKQGIYLFPLVENNAIENNLKKIEKAEGIYLDVSGIFKISKITESSGTYYDLVFNDSLVKTIRLNQTYFSNIKVDCKEEFDIHLSGLNRDAKKELSEIDKKQKN